MSDLAAFEEFVRSECARLQMPGAVVGLRRNGVDTVIPVGITNAEHPLPVDADTLFQVASITKTFTTTLLMTFVQDGQIALDDRVWDHLPDLDLGDPERTAALQVHHLVTHTAGWDGDALFADPRGLSLSGVAGRVGQIPRRFDPGQNWSYNNAAFSLVGQLIEVLSGQRFVDALRTRVLVPSGIDQAFTTADEVVTRRVAAPHVVIDGNAIVLRGAGWQRGWELVDFDVPAGGVVTSAPALLRWGAIALGEVAGPLDDEHRRSMQRRLRAAGGNTDAMGLGWLHADLGGVATLGHDGMTVGYLSSLVIVPAANLVVVSLTNALGGTAFNTSIRDYVLREFAGAREILPEIVAPPSDASALVGRYDDPFYVLEVRPAPEPERLLIAQVQRPPEAGRWTPPALGEPSPIAPISGDRWMVLEPEGSRGGIIDVGRNADGTVEWIRRGSRICPRS
jgi:CubicO group peptidase (beta-lactamase class C family)